MAAATPERAMPAPMAKVVERSDRDAEAARLDSLRTGVFGLAGNLLHQTIGVDTDRLLEASNRYGPAAEGRRYLGKSEGRLLISHMVRLGKTTNAHGPALGLTHEYRRIIARVEALYDRRGRLPLPPLRLGRFGLAATARLEPVYYRIERFIGEDADEFAAGRAARFWPLSDDDGIRIGRGTDETDIVAFGVAAAELTEALSDGEARVVRQLINSPD